MRDSLNPTGPGPRAHECCDLKAPQNSANRGKPRQDNSAYHQLGLSSGSGKEFGNGQHSNDTSLDKLHGLVGMVVDAVEKERVDNLEQANQELERLRGHIDRLQAELQEALQEAEVHQYCGAASGAASGERRKQTLDNVRSMPQLAAARNAARLAARVDWRGARRRRAARCASETNVLESIEAATAQSGARGGIKWTD
ncbi:unnamed protein product [Plutella xylostella]|uniref:(diamondback moth) hypothetical protein n=1 Tax=Plutella xylostella TaxID=51655 RepID=A0A8S4FPG5_PLUXY|nr:unnamed protein product [Plutella xylostella]